MKTKADEYIDKIVDALCEKENTTHTRLLIAALIQSLLSNWAYQKEIHIIDLLGILEAVKWGLKKQLEEANEINNKGS